MSGSSCPWLSRRRVASRRSPRAMFHATSRSPTRASAEDMLTQAKWRTLAWRKGTKGPVPRQSQPAPHPLCDGLGLSLRAGMAARRRSGSDHAAVWVKLGDARDRCGAALRHASGLSTLAASTALPKTERSTHRTDDGGRRRSCAARIGQPELSGRPLLVIDGNSFAHRSYHALPKTIRRSDGKGAGAILGFANFLLRLHEDEQPRAVIVGRS